MEKWDSAVASSSLDPEVFRLPVDLFFYVLETLESEPGILAL
jgi:hypothetical protein